MREIKYYRTYSYRTVGDRGLDIRDFENIQLAKDDALSDIKNINFSLYEITMIFDGKITESRKYLGRLVCGKELQNFTQKENVKRI